MHSYPTPDTVGIERMNDGFVKVHHGPVHIFTDARDEEFHDHPFDFTTHIVAGGYTEEVLVWNGSAYEVNSHHRGAGTSHQVTAGTIHRITGLPQGFCVTRAEYGQTVRTPGFYQLREGVLYHRFWNQPEYQPLA